MDLIEIGEEHVRQLILRSIERWDKRAYRELLEYITFCDSLKRRESKFAVHKCDTWSLEIVHEVLVPWLDGRLKAMINKQVIDEPDPLIDENDFLVPEALDILDRRLCICGGGSCSAYPDYECYERGKILFGQKYFCNMNVAYVDWCRRVGFSHGTPWVGVGEPILSADVDRIFYDKSNKRIQYQGIVTNTLNTEYNAQSIVYGVYPNGYRSNVDCCASCPEGYVHGIGSSYLFPVWYFSESRTIYPNERYIIALLLSVS